MVHLLLLCWPTTSPLGCCCVLNVYLCIPVVILGDHCTLCDLNPSGRHSFNFLMGNIKWAAVLRESCLGGPLGFLLIPIVRGEAEELNPASWPPLCSCYLFPWFLCSNVPHLFQDSSADIVCVLHSLHLYFPLPRAGFCCGYWVLCWSQPKISSVVCCCILTSIQHFHLLWFCLVFDISALLCYYAHSNICKYVASLNTNVPVLLFCMCFLSQVLVFDPVRVGRV